MAFKWWKSLDETRELRTFYQSQAFEAAQRTNRENRPAVDEAF